MILSHHGRRVVVVVVVVVVLVEVVFDDGTLVDTPTRCNNTKNNREERVRISRAIRTGVAGNGGGWRLDVVVVVV